MRYAATEKLKVIWLVEQSLLSVRRTLEQLGIPRSTFYCWYDRYRAGRAEGLADRTPAPRRLWNKLPAEVTQAVLELALKEPQLSPRELAVSFVDRQQYFVSEASVYRVLKAHDLITSPAFILLKAADTFAEPTTAPNQLWLSTTRLRPTSTSVSCRAVRAEPGGDDNLRALDETFDKGRPAVVGLLAGIASLARYNLALVCPVYFALLLLWRRRATSDLFWFIPKVCVGGSVLRPSRTR